MVTIDNRFLPNEKEEKTLVRDFPLDEKMMAVN
jgi:hypothetical protein